MNLEWREVQGCCERWSSHPQNGLPAKHQTAYAKNAAAFTGPALYPFCLREYICPFRRNCITLRVCTCAHFL